MNCPLGIQNCISCDSNEVHTDRESLESEANILLGATEKTVFALATLYRALGLDPHGLRFHRECVKDHHACPGKNVVQADMIARVVAAMGH
jgi:hypothetical protein